MATVIVRDFRQLKTEHQKYAKGSKLAGLKTLKDLAEINKKRSVEILERARARFTGHLIDSVKMKKGKDDSIIVICDSNIGSVWEFGLKKPIVLYPQMESHHGYNVEAWMVRRGIETGRVIVGKSTGDPIRKGTHFMEKGSDYAMKRADKVLQKYLLQYIK